VLNPDDSLLSASSQRASLLRMTVCELCLAVCIFMAALMLAQN
jgi:hypothetical protein